MSDNVGCIAPLSVAVADITSMSEDTQRHVVFFVSDTGVQMTDGATIIPISGDIASYWDPNHADYIPAAYQKKY